MIRWDIDDRLGLIYTPMVFVGVFALGTWADPVDLFGAGVGWVTRGLFLIAIALILVAASVFYAAASHPRPFAPLGPFPEQRVTNERNANGLPVVSLRQPVVTVRGTKCSDPFDGQIGGTVSWQSINPRGVTIVSGQGTRDAPTADADRCVSFTFRNDIPEGVQSVMARQINDGFHPVWRIIGTETPTSSQRGIGVPLTWATEPFRVPP